MKQRIFPKAYLLVGFFPLIALVFLTVLYLVVGGILEVLNVLPLRLELLMNYHVLTICLPIGFIVSIHYWVTSGITIKQDEVILRTSITKFKREKIKMGDILELCVHEKEENDSTTKFHIHLKDDDVKIVEFWYDEKALILLAKALKTINPKIKFSKKLQKVMV